MDILEAGTSTEQVLLGVHEDRTWAGLAYPDVPVATMRTWAELERVGVPGNRTSSELVQVDVMSTEQVMLGV